MSTHQLPSFSGRAQRSRRRLLVSIVLLAFLAVAVISAITLTQSAHADETGTKGEATCTTTSADVVGRESQSTSITDLDSGIEEANTGHSTVNYFGSPITVTIDCQVERAANAPAETVAVSVTGSPDPADPSCSTYMDVMMIDARDQIAQDLRVANLRHEITMAAELGRCMRFLGDAVKSLAP
jgi:hypothetical protein